MNKKDIKPYLFLFLFLFVTLSISKPLADTLRSYTLSVLPRKMRSSQKKTALLKKKDALIALLTKRVEELSQMQTLSKNMQKLPKALVAKVLLRPLSSYDHTLWIDVGSRDNLPDEEPLVSLYSPVLDHLSVIGVIDYVGEKQSRVRLITDPSSKIAVRAIRGVYENHTLLTTAEHFEQELITTKSTLSEEKKSALVSLLQEIKKELSTKEAPKFLAKGEVSGEGKSAFRRPKPTLSGTYFNYDFQDDYSAALDLRLGTPQDAKERKPFSLLEEGDHLITSGLDGIFPEGLPVAVVSHVKPLREGDYYYECSCTPLSKNIDNLSDVIVISPVLREGLTFSDF